MDGALYLEEYATSASLGAKGGRSEEDRKQSYVGYAFESYCTTEEGVTPTDAWGGDVNTNVQWCTVVKTKLGDIRMLIGGEVDCITSRTCGSICAPHSLLQGRLIRQSASRQLSRGKLQHQISWN